MHEKITFNATYKGKRREFVIDPANGTGGTWFLFIDKFYYGVFLIYKGAWEFRPQKDESFSPEQIKILVDQLQKHHPVP